MHSIRLDQFDARLLRALQEDGKLTNAELSERVHLSPSQCQRRLKKLEELGVVLGYVAMLDRVKIGLGVMAIVNVSLSEHSEESVRMLEQAIEQNPQILEGWAVLGETDYLLRVVAANVEELSNLLLHKLLRLKVVAGLRTSIMLRAIKSTTALPLEIEGYTSGRFD